MRIWNRSESKPLKKRNSFGWNIIFWSGSMMANDWTRFRWRYFPGVLHPRHFRDRHVLGRLISVTKSVLNDSNGLERTEWSPALFSCNQLHLHLKFFWMQYWPMRIFLWYYFDSRKLTIASTFSAKNQKTKNMHLIFLKQEKMPYRRVVKEYTDTGKD